MQRTEIIKSRDNVRLKFARRVRDGKESGLIFVEGLRMAGEALRSGIEIEEGFVSETFAEKNRAIVRDLTTSVRYVSSNLFDSIADTENSQGIVLIAKRPERKIESASKIQLALFLYEVNNPANLGAVMRTAEAAGVDRLFVSENSADAFSPKAIRASMGSCFRLPIIAHASIDEILDWARSNGIVTAAADINAVISYTEVDWSCPVLLIVGSEAHGLPSEILDKIDRPIKIPMSGDVESLNLAVSTGIILFEARRQITLAEN